MDSDIEADSTINDILAPLISGQTELTEDNNLFIPKNVLIIANDATVPQSSSAVAIPFVPGDSSSALERSLANNQSSKTAKLCTSGELEAKKIGSKLADIVVNVTESSSPPRPLLSNMLLLGGSSDPYPFLSAAALTDSAEIDYEHLAVSGHCRVVTAFKGDEIYYNVTPTLF